MIRCANSTRNCAVVAVPAMQCTLIDPAWTINPPENVSGLYLLLAKINLTRFRFGIVE
jgi:hypothetical protein